MPDERTAKEGGGRLCARLSRLFGLFRGKWRCLPAAYLAVLFIMTAGVLLYQPIAAFDSDLWYHLSAGRFMFSNHAFPYGSFFSFLTPPRPLYDYSWLFQILVFAVHSAGGYTALLILRTAVFVGTLLAIGRFLFGKEYRTPSLYGCLVFSLCALFLVQRYLLVRPHIFSFLFIPVFLGILESRGRWLPVLPLLAALWGNIHGIESPVICLILGSYIAERLFQPRSEEQPAERRRFLAYAALAMPAVFVTPLGWKLFEIIGSFIFGDVSYFQRIQGEREVLRLADLASFHISGGSIDAGTLFNVFLLLAGLSAVAALARRKLRVSHFLLLAGGVCLLAGANRMRYECLLLLLPLIKANPPFDPKESARLFRAPVLAVLAAALLFLPYLYLKPLYEHRARYPFSARNLPQGVVSFLKYINSGGNIWNIPSPGGYLEWTLYPRYLIATDTANTYNASDLYLAKESFYDRGLLGRIIRRYDPDFILAPLLNPDFSGLIAPFPEYVLVFFDDRTALYANSRSRPDITRTYSLKEAPYYVDWRLPLPDPAFASERMPADISRMLEIDPESLITRWRAAAFCARKGDFKEELAHAEAMIRNYPENRFGYLVKGNALRQLKRYDEAMSVLRQALEREDGPVGDDVVELEMLLVYQARGQFTQTDRLLDALEPGRPPKSWAREQVQKAGPAPECR